MDTIPIDSTEKRPYEAIFKSNLLLLLLKGTGDFSSFIPLTRTDEMMFTQDFFLEMDGSMCSNIFNRVIQMVFVSLTSLCVMTRCRKIFKSM